MTKAATVTIMMDTSNLQRLLRIVAKDLVENQRALVSTCSILTIYYKLNALKYIHTYAYIKIYIAPKS